VVAAVPSARLCIVGSSPPPEILALAGPAVTVTGGVSTEALNGLYAAAQVAIVPLRFGAGVKGKIFEALSFGTPVVSTSIGAQGLTGVAPQIMAVGDTTQAFAAAVAAILRDTSPAMARALAGLEFLERHASEAAARNALAPDVPEMATGRPPE
jgi:glycosyltransferase involved in cell wall biosynthesis